MVTTTVDKLSDTRVKLTIAVSPEEFKPSITTAYQQIAEQVNIPGFRKGKVPPAIIDQRVGRESVLEQALNVGLDGYFRTAVTENNLKPIGRPDADVAEWPSSKDFSGDLQVTVEVDVRPEIELPKYEGLDLVVDAVDVEESEVEEELERLRGRFGTLITVERPAKTGDLVTIDLEATLNGALVDTATDVNYELGSGQLLDGIDEALDSLTAGESTTFESKLLGGDHEGEMSLIAITLKAVKERELPEADDDFAQIASEFDTIAELRANLRETVEKSKRFGQAGKARTAAIEALTALVTVPVPENVIEDEVKTHLENEGKPLDDPHGDEVREAAIKNFQSSVILDGIAEKEQIQVSQDELSQYVVRSAAQYGMDPNEFIRALDAQGQIPQIVADIARSKAAAIVVEKANVTDTNGKAVDLSEVTGSSAGAAHDHDDHEGHDHD